MGQLNIDPSLILRIKLGDLYTGLEKEYGTEEATIKFNSFVDEQMKMDGVEDAIKDQINSVEESLEDLQTEIKSLSQEEIPAIPIQITNIIAAVANPFSASTGPAFLSQLVLTVMGLVSQSKLIVNKVKDFERKFKGLGLDRLSSLSNIPLPNIQLPNMPEIPETPEVTKPEAELPPIYKVTPSSSGSGTIVPDTEYQMGKGGNVAFTFIPTDDAQILKVYINGKNNKDAIKNKCYEFKNIKKNNTIKVVFEDKSVSSLFDDTSIIEK